ncbi:MAG: hypothetical protein JST70_01945 [Bacteroidetes bacterium]|nr:hypothetical protein [Bacteroidota bacterium]
MKNIFQQTNIIFSGILLIAFFMPWVNLSFISLSAYEIPEKMRAINNGVNFFIHGSSTMPYLYVAYALYLIPIFCLTTIIRGVAGYSTKAFSFIAATVAITLLVYAISLIGEVILKIATIGLYITSITSFILFFASLPLNTPKQPNPYIEKRFDEANLQFNVAKNSSDFNSHKKEEQSDVSVGDKPRIGDWLKDNPGKTINDYYSIYR